MVADSTIAIPVFDTARQDALNGTSIEERERLSGQAKFLQPPEVEQALLCLLHHTVGVKGPLWPRNLKLLTLSTVALSIR